MSLESILKHILDESGSGQDKIIQDARLQADKIIQETKAEAEKLYQEIMNKEKTLALANKQKLIVNARLEERKNLLEAKQALIDRVFEKLKATLKSGGLKKQQVFDDTVKEVSEDIAFYLNKLRTEYETEIARIIFE